MVVRGRCKLACERALISKYAQGRVGQNDCAFSIFSLKPLNVAFSDTIPLNGDVSHQLIPLIPYGDDLVADRPEMSAQMVDIDA